LQDAQELDLKCRRYIADLVEKDGAAVGLLEQPDMIADRPGEGALAMPEQFAFQQLIRQRAAVLGDERSLRAQAVVMQRTGKQLLAGAGFAGQQHRDVVGRNLRHLLADGVQRAVGRTHDGIQPEAALQPMALLGQALFQARRADAVFQRQAFILTLQLVEPAGVGHRQQQIVRMPGLGDVLIDAGPIDPVDDVLGIGIAGDDDPHHVRPAIAHPLNNSTPVVPGMRWSDTTTCTQSSARICSASVAPRAVRISNSSSRMRAIVSSDSGSSSTRSTVRASGISHKGLRFRHS
jgi:hypothetical protein